jgi:hypothetical protein
LSRQTPSSRTNLVLYKNASTANLLDRNILIANWNNLKNARAIVKSAADIPGKTALDTKNTYLMTDKISLAKCSTILKGSCRSFEVIAFRREEILMTPKENIERRKQLLDLSITTTS